LRKETIVQQLGTMTMMMATMKTSRSPCHEKNRTTGVFLAAGTRVAIRMGRWTPFAKKKHHELADSLKYSTNTNGNIEMSG
jgi:hypothetical protein